MFSLLNIGINLSSNYIDAFACILDVFWLLVLYTSVVDFCSVTGANISICDTVKRTS